VTDYQSLYVSRIVTVAPDEVEAAFDAMRRGGDSYVINVPGGRLELKGDGALRRPEGARYYPLRQVKGVLHLGRLQAIDVDVELLPWSKDQSEIAVRPAGRTPFGVRDSYFAVAGTAADRLATAVEAFHRDSVHLPERVAA
jgi:hypothetical protein